MNKLVGLCRVDTPCGRLETRRSVGRTKPVTRRIFVLRLHSADAPYCVAAPIDAVDWPKEVRQSPAAMRYFPTMKRKPNSQNALPGKADRRGPCFLHGADEPELNADEVRQRASRLSGVLSKILTRHDSPEHVDLGR